MTVAELIQQLKKYPLHSQVRLKTYGEAFCSNIEQISIELIPEQQLPMLQARIVGMDYEEKAGKTVQVVVLKKKY